MPYRNSYQQLLEQVQFLQAIVLVLLCVLLILIIRNWYNLYKKRSYRKKLKLYKTTVESLETKLVDHNVFLERYERLKTLNASLHIERETLKNRLEEADHTFNKKLYEKEEELKQHKENFEYQRKAYERYADFKIIDANNTRLGGHFIKNVLNHIYQDLEVEEAPKFSIFGLYLSFEKPTSRALSIKALKDIFKLLDYNVAAGREKVFLESEIHHIEIFLHLIQYLKPKAKATFQNNLPAIETEKRNIKPTLLFPFLENALKHGNLNSDHSIIAIEINQLDQKQICYSVINTCENRDKTNISEKPSFGLTALKKLVETHYPDSQLQTKMLEDNKYMAKLILNLD